MRLYDAVVFDLDGTLLDTLADIGNAANESLSQLGLPTRELSEYGQFVGAGVANLFECAIVEPAIIELAKIDSEGNRSELVRQCVSSFDETYARHWDQLSKPYPGILSLIKELSRLGVKQAILSNKPHEFTRLCVAQFFSDETFFPVLGQRPDVPKKPDPIAVFEILTDLNVPLHRALFVGDTPVDIQTAKNAGIDSVAVTWGFRDAGELEAEHPTYLAYTAEQLRQCLLAEETGR